MRPGGPPLSRPAGTAWLVTFSDLVVLMLAFFVLLFSMSVLRGDAFDRLSESLAGTFRAAPAVSTAPAGGPAGVAGPVQPRGQDLGYLAGLLRATLAEDDRFKGAVVRVLDRRLIILLPADLLFQPGGARVATAARPALAELAGLLGNLRNRVAVAGHAAPRGEDGADDGLDDAWDLSLARAAAVANGLRRAGYGGDLQVWAHADSRADSVAALPPDRRARLARRVDVVVLPDLRDADPDGEGRP